MYDPKTNVTALRAAFNKIGGFDESLAEHPLDIPNNREPEIAGLLHDGPVAQPNYFKDIYAGLANSPDVVIVGEMEGTNRLMSLALDTPLGEVRKAGYSRRMRFSLLRAEGENDELEKRDHDFIEFGRGDHTLKTWEKTTDRIELEGIAHSLSCRGEHLAVEHPTFPEKISRLDPESYRVSAACIVARGMYSLIHYLPDYDAAVQYDICNDMGVATTPHADRDVGKFAEIEAEAKHVYSGAIRPDDHETVNRVLNVSLDRLWATIHGSVPRGHISESKESKMARSQNMVSRAYRRENSTLRSLVDGFYHALNQNVRPEDFNRGRMKGNLSVLSMKLPTAKELTPSNFPENFDRYLDENDLAHGAGNVIVMPARKLA